VSTDPVLAAKAGDRIGRYLLEDVLVESPEAGAYHVILNHRRIHERQKAWRQARPNVHFHWSKSTNDYA
jgi:hypothetical protein